MAGYPSDCGHRDYLVSRTDRALASNPTLSPAAKARILGKARPHEAATEHWITVDCRTGERTVKTPIPPLRPAAPIIAPPVVLPVRIRPMPVPPREAGLHIIAVVARHFEVDPQAIIAVGRNACFVRPRQACYLLIRMLLGASLPRIGRIIGKRDHTTVRDGLRTALKRLDHEPDWRRRFNAALSELKSEATP